MDIKLKELKEKALQELKDLKEDISFDDLKNKYLGRKGELNNLLKEVKNLSKEEKPKIGKLANEIKKELTDLFNKTEAIVKGEVKKDTDFDSSLPGKKKKVGNLHPSTIIQREIESAFVSMGFKIYDGPQLDSDYYNFTALNIPEDHPAKGDMDTFWVEDNNVLRTHTSNLQVRMLEEYGTPFRGIFPGRVFRNESTDASHDHTFYQLEGLMVDKDINIGHLIATMKSLLSAVFHKKVDIRLRPGFFPFVEPGFEMDIRCLVCEGEGCSVCKQSGWLELMPCGMVHPKVLEAGGVDSKEYSGFAFGLGLTRLVMMRYKINDIRLLQSGDLRFLKQF